MFYKLTKTKGIFAYIPFVSLNNLTDSFFLQLYFSAWCFQIEFLNNEFEHKVEYNKVYNSQFIIKIQLELL